MMTTAIYNRQTQSLNPLRAVKKWLDNQEIKEENLARQIVKLIPSQCPFARQIRLCERVLFSIPPLCKLNPLYEQLISLRFRAMQLSS